MKRPSSAESKTQPPHTIGKGLCDRKVFLASWIMTILFALSIFLFHNRLHYATKSQLSVTENNIEQFPRSISSPPPFFTNQNFDSTVEENMKDISIRLWLVKIQEGIMFHTEPEKNDIFFGSGALLMGRYNTSSNVFYIYYPLIGEKKFLSETHFSSSVTESGLTINISCDGEQLPSSQSDCSASEVLGDTDFVGNDIENIECTESMECCSACVGKDGCTHWTYVETSHTCWLKTGVPNKVQSSGRSLISGIIRERKQINQRELRHKVAFSNKLPECTSSMPTNAERAPYFRSHFHSSPSLIRHNLTNGDWSEQFPLGNGKFGALVGGSRRYEVIPLSAANFFAYKPTYKKSSNERKKSMSSFYVTGREKLKTGLIAESISSLSNTQTGGLGMFQYLSDLVIAFSPCPIIDAPQNIPHNRIIGMNRATIMQWFHEAFQDIAGSHVRSSSIISEISLDLSSGIAYENHIEAHTASISNSSEIKWISATNREWFISAVDNVLVGLINCKAETTFGGDRNCLNVAIGVIREFNGEEDTPNVGYEMIHAKRTNNVDTFDLNLEISSSKSNLVPTSHISIRILCYHGNTARIVGEKSQGTAGFTDSPLAVCNSASRIAIIATTESIDSLGVDPQEFEISNNKLKLKNSCWSRIVQAEKKGILKVRADHIAQVTEAMRSVSFSLDKNADMSIKPPLGEITREYLHQFGNGCYNSKSDSVESDVHDTNLVMQLYSFGRYLLLCSAQNNVPNLQGIWSDGIRAEWNGDYHLNINFQMMYWAAASSFPLRQNRKDIFNSLLRFVKRLSIRGKETAQAMYKDAAKSAKCQQKLSENAWVAHGFTDSSLRAEVMADLQWSLCVTCGAWAASHLLDIFLYSDINSLDKDSLIEVVEIYRGVADFFNAHLFVLDNDQSTVLHTGPTTSPENSYTIISKNKKTQETVGKTSYLTFSPAIDISILREISNSYYLITRWTKSVLVDEKFDYFHHAENFQLLVTNLPNHGIPLAYPDSRELLKEPERSDVANCTRIHEYPIIATTSVGDQIIENTDMGHRHFSLLHWLYPSQLLPLTSNLEKNDSLASSVLYQAAKESLQIKRKNFGGHTSWSSVWEASLWARLGEGEESFLSIKHLISRYLTTNLLSLHPTLNAVGPPDCHTCFTDSYNQELELMRELEKKKQVANIGHQRRLLSESLQPDEGTFIPPPLRSEASIPHLSEVRTIDSLDPLKHLEGSINTPSADARNLRREHPLHELVSGRKRTNSNQTPKRTNFLEKETVSRRRGLITDKGYKFQLDGNLGFIAAIHEMLVHSHLPHRLILLPAIPRSWQIGGHIEGLGIRGNAKVSIHWKKSEVTTLKIEFDSIDHPWWFGQIGEHKNFPGFYEYQDNPALAENEVSILSPNRLRFLSTSTSDLSFPLCSIRVDNGKWCKNCNPLPYQENMEISTVYIEHSKKVCTLLACRYELSEKECWSRFAAKDVSLVN